MGILWSVKMMPTFKWKAARSLATHLQSIKLADAICFNKGTYLGLSYVLCSSQRQHHHQGLQ